MKTHLGEVLRAGLLGVAHLTTQRAVIGPFWAALVPTADAVHLWSSGLSLDKRRFKRNRRNRVDVDRDYPHLVDSPKGTDTSFVDAQGGDVDTGKESSSTRMHARVAQILEFHARALSSLEVNSPRGVASDA